MKVLALRLQAKLLVRGGNKAACKWEERSVPECYGGQQLCCDFYKPSRVRHNAFLPPVCFLSQFSGPENSLFFFRPESFAKLNWSCWGWAFFFLPACWSTSGWSELSCAWFQAAAAARGSCYCLHCFGGSRLQPAFLFGNSLCLSCWSVTWALQLTYPKELNANFFACHSGVGLKSVLMKTDGRYRIITLKRGR